MHVPGAVFADPPTINTMLFGGELPGRVVRVEVVRRARQLLMNWTPNP